jgi:ATP-binding protein involved in chromosome partitioning
VAQSLEGQVLAALSRLQNPRLENDLVSAGMVRDLTVDSTGRVAFTFLLGRDDPATLVREARKAIRELDGVSDIKIAVVDPAGAPKATHAPPGGPQSASTGVPAPQPMAQPNLGRVIAISSGKGGVGKSTVAANLAIALAQQGFAVGVMDADVYGPNIPRMFGVFEKPPVVGGRIQPLEAHGVRLMSLGLLVDRDTPAIWRGPIIMKIVQQFLRDVEWGELDYFIVDLPPGTGDALRGAKMFEKVGVPVVGVVENMSAFTDPETGKRFELFSSGGGQRLADEVGVPLLGSVPLQPGLAQAADVGLPVLAGAPGSPAAGVLREIAVKVQEAVAARPMSLPILNG